MQDIYVGDTGKGFPFVFVHGFLGSSEMWNPQIQFFKNKYRIITPSLPGFGKSNKAQSKNSIEAMAKFILDCLEEKNIKKFYLLGHSMGGMIVQEIAKLVGEKIDKLICYGTGSVGSIPGRFETIDESREKLKKNGLEVTANRIAKTWFVEEDKSKYFYLCKDAGKATSLQAADNALIAMKNWSGLKNLKNIKNQTLIIWGDKDKAYNFKQVDTLNKHIPNAAFKIFKDCSHNVHLEKPDEFNKYIAQFLERKFK
ncbi:alpha/beta hydrolase [Candidatus Pelagibacter sp.]|nr:alpha/beta hydrolase [Candidatus Pelagibacter sp.]